jgi:hypothetical protein
MKVSMEFFCTQAKAIVAAAEELFPTAFNHITADKRESIIFLVGDTLLLCVRWILPTKRAVSALNIRRNMNQLEWIVIGGLRDEEADNLKRFFSLVNRAGGVVAAIISRFAPDFTLSEFLNGEDSPDGR